MAYISEFDRQQLVDNLNFIKTEIGKLHTESPIKSRLTTCLRTMGMTLSEKDRMPFCTFCGEALTYKCKKCE